MGGWLYQDCSPVGRQLVNYHNPARRIATSPMEESNSTYGVYTIQQTSSKLIQNTRANAGRLPDRVNTLLTTLLHQAATQDPRNHIFCRTSPTLPPLTDTVNESTCTSARSVRYTILHILYAPRRAMVQCSRSYRRP